MKNKRGELILLSIFLLAIIIGGIYYIEGDIQKKRYIGDSSSMVYYYLDNKNLNCSLSNIKIDINNLVFFNSAQQAEKEKFRKDDKCN